MVWVRAVYITTDLNMICYKNVVLNLVRTQPPIQRVPGALSLEVKRPKRETDHLHLAPSLRMRGAIPPLPQYVFMPWCSDRSLAT